MTMISHIVSVFPLPVLWVEAPHRESPPSMFSGHCSSTSGDIEYSKYYMASQNQVIEGLCNFKTGSSLWYVSTLPSLVAIVIVVVEI